MDTFLSGQRHASSQNPLSVTYSKSTVKDQIRSSIRYCLRSNTDKTEYVAFVTYDDDTI